MKILDNDFRKELYKSLMEAGYEKQEAQKIVATKYAEALKDKLASCFSELNEKVLSCTLEALSAEWLAEVNNDINEFQKMNTILNG